MKVDYREYAKKALEKLKSKNDFGDNKKKDLFFKPQAEDKQVRMIGYPHDDDPFPSLWFHYKIAGRKGGILCLEKNFGEECPICELGRKLAKTGDPNDKAFAKKLFAAQRFFGVVVDRDDNPLVPKLWSFGISIYRDLIDSLNDEDDCMFLDPIEGIDGTVSLIESEGRQFPTPKFKLKRKSSRLADTDEEIENIMSSAPKLDDIFKKMSASEINKILEDWISVPEDEGTEKGGKSQEEEEQSGEEIKESIEEAFDKALEDLD